MTSIPIELRPSSRIRFAAAVAGLFLLQVGLIFWLGERTPAKTGPPLVESAFRQVPLELQHDLVIERPALFALPAMEGFSGEGWLTSKAWLTPPMRPFAWTEEPRWLPLDLQQLGGTFSPLVGAASFSIDPIPARPVPELTLPVTTQEPLGAGPSVLRLGPGMEGRALEQGPDDLPSWANADLLTNTIVQVAIDASGRPLSATLLGSSSLRVADQFALDKALQVRFSPAPPELLERPARLAFGQLIFQWQTVAPPAAPGGGK